MDVLIEVNGFVDVPDSVNNWTATNDFIDWIEERHWYFGGGFRGEGHLDFLGTIYSLEQALTIEMVETPLRNWFREQGWHFEGSFRTIVDDYYMNPDGSRGSHVLEDF